MRSSAARWNGTNSALSKSSTGFVNTSSRLITEKIVNSSKSRISHSITVCAEPGQKFSASTCEPQILETDSRCRLRQFRLPRSQMLIPLHCDPALDNRDLTDRLPPGFRQYSNNLPASAHCRPCRSRNSRAHRDRKSTRLNSSHLGI